MTSGIQVLKIGGSILTDKNSAEPVFAADNARRLAAEIAGLSRLPIVVHGTGSYGKPPAKQYGYMCGTLPRQKAHVISTVSGILELLRENVLHAFRDAGIPAVSLSAGSLVVAQNGSIVNCNWEPVVAFAERGVLPVISGDFVIDLEHDFAVCSSDLIATSLAVAARAQRLVFATDVPRLIIPGEEDLCEPQTISRADCSRWQDALHCAADDVSHGMTGKLAAAFLASDHGIDTFMVDGTVPGAVFSALNSELPQATRLVSNCRTVGQPVA